MKNCGMPAN